MRIRRSVLGYNNSALTMDDKYSYDDTTPTYPGYANPAYHASNTNMTVPGQTKIYANQDEVEKQRIDSLYSKPQKGLKPRGSPGRSPSIEDPYYLNTNGRDHRMKKIRGSDYMNFNGPATFVPDVMQNGTGPTFTGKKKMSSGAPEMVENDIYDPSTQRRGDEMYSKPWC